jgi:hypothetical protein
MKICYRVTVSGIQTATKAHLHMGNAVEEGDIVKLNLLPPRNSARECVIPIQYSNGIICPCRR